ncbi:MAG: hypothetical protein R3D99_10540 [Altererythrobacter sp.]
MKFLRIIGAVACLAWTGGCTDQTAMQPGNLPVWSIGDGTASFGDNSMAGWIRLECATDGGGRPFVRVVRAGTDDIREHIVQDMQLALGKKKPKVRVSAHSSGEGRQLDWAGPALDRNLKQLFAVGKGEISVKSDQRRATKWVTTCFQKEG